MNSTKTNTRKGERGNALFLILIAVALFAALSYAVTQSGRGSGSIDKEQGQISAAQITQFPAAVRTAATRMVITGTAIPDVDFDTAAGGVAGDSVFATAGGGVVYQKPPTAGVDSTDYNFVSAVDTAGGGFFIYGVGSNSNETGRDAFAWLKVKTATCTAINRGLGLSGTATSETAGGDAAWVPPTGNDGKPNQAGGTTGLGDDADGTHAYEIGKNNTTAQAFACVDNSGSGDTDADGFIYYHALIEQ